MRWPRWAADLGDVALVEGLDVLAAEVHCLKARDVLAPLPSR
jgi:hypothetical protein